MKYCVEIKQAHEHPKHYWHTKEFDTEAEAKAFMDKHIESDRQFGQEGMWNYRIAKLRK